MFPNTFSIEHISFISLSLYLSTQNSLSCLLPPHPIFPLIFPAHAVLFPVTSPLHDLTAAPCWPSTNLSSVLDALLWALVQREDPGPGPPLGGTGEAPQEAAGQVWQRAAALLRSDVLRAERFAAGAGSHQVNCSLQWDAPVTFGKLLIPSGHYPADAMKKCIQGSVWGG